MIRIRLSMNGESPMMSPVIGSRSGASGNTVSRPITTSTAAVAISAYRRPFASASGETSGPLSASSDSSSVSSAGSCVPRLRSTMYTETSVRTMVTRTVEAIPK